MSVTANEAGTDLSESLSIKCHGPGKGKRHFPEIPPTENQLGSPVKDASLKDMTTAFWQDRGSEWHGAKRLISILLAPRNDSQ